MKGLGPTLGEPRAVRREIGGIKRIGSVSSSEGAARMNAYRAGLSARDWGLAQRQRLGAASGAPVAPACAGPASTSPVDAIRNLPLYVTRHPDSRRDWTEVGRLLERLNQIFAPARIGFQLREPCDGQRLADSSEGCPFEGDLNHDFEWLHLALVDRLPGDVPRRFSCGRCLMVSDACDDRGLAQAVGGLLGLLPVSNLHVSNLLMSGGTGTALVESECAWLGWQAAMMLGDETPLPLLRLPVWVYEVEAPESVKTQRSQPQVRQLLERVNLVWGQAGIEFDFYNWCHLQEPDLDATGWAKVNQGDLSVLGPLVQYGPRAAHLFLRGGPAGPPITQDPAQFVVVLSDALQTGRTRALAASLGACLGLTAVSGADQLMSGGSGFRLSASESARARARGLERVRTSGRAGARSLNSLKEEVATPAAQPLSELTVTLKLFLIRGKHAWASRQTCQEAAQWLEGVNAILSQAGIRLLTMSISEVELELAALEPALPNPKGHTGQRPCSCLSLTRTAGYDPRLLNVFMLDQLPVFATDQVTTASLWVKSQTVLVAERFAPYSPEKILALTLARFWGLSDVPSAPFYRLMGPRTVGVRLSAEEVTRLRAALTPATVNPDQGSCGLPTLCVPVKLHLVENNCPLSPEQARAALEEANGIWAQAGIRWLAVDCQRVSVEPEALQASYPHHPKNMPERIVSAEGLTRVNGYDPQRINLFLVHKIPYVGETYFVGSQSFRDRRLALVAEQHFLTPNFVILARALAQLLNLSFSKDDQQHLACYTGLGTALRAEEVRKARSQVEKLNEVLEPGAQSGGLVPLKLPVRVHLVRNAKHGTSLSLSEITATLGVTAEMFKQMGIHLEIHVCQELSLSEADLEAAFPSERGDTTRKKSSRFLTGAAGYAATAINLFLVKQVVSVLGTERFLSVQDKEAQIILLTDHDKDFSEAKRVARTLAWYLELTANDFALPDSLRAFGPGTRLSPREVDKLRASLVRLFPTPSVAVSSVACSTPLPQAPPSLAAGTYPVEEILRLPLRLCRVRGSHACSLTSAELAARIEALELWALAGVRPDIVATQEIDVPLEALLEAFPNPPGKLTARMPFNFGLMRLPGHDVRLLNLFMVGNMPVGSYSIFALSKMLLVSQEPVTALAAALGEFMGLSGTTTAAQIDKARDHLRRLFA